MGLDAMMVGRSVGGTADHKSRQWLGKITQFTDEVLGAAGFDM